MLFLHNYISAADAAIGIVTTAEGGSSIEIRDRQSGLTQSFHTAVKVLGVSEGKDAAAALDGKIGIDLECLFPRASALLRPAEVAVA
jgi:hypothetical protein